jgi:hypothetical protein
VPERPTDGCTERERGALQGVRDHGEAQVVEVVLRDHRQPQRVRHALPGCLAIGGETEHRLDQLLERSGGSTGHFRRIGRRASDPDVGAASGA